MSFLIWARRDSNPRPKDYESSALPLRHRPVAIVILLSCFRRCVSGKTPFPALPTSPRKIIGRVPQAHGDYYSVVTPPGLSIWNRNDKSILFTPPVALQILYYQLNTKKSSRFIKYYNTPFSCNNS